MKFRHPNENNHMKRIVISSALTLAVTAPFIAHGADPGATDSLNRFYLGGRLGLNFKASFRNHAPVNPGPAAGGADHLYNDGYVFVDNSGNAGGLTWNWGYQNNSQVVGDTMQFNAIDAGNSASTAHRKATDDPQAGIELTYQRILGSLSSDSSVRWGLEAGFAYTELDLRDHRSQSGPVTVTTDTFQLNGVVPPGAGYNGTFAGPGALLGDTPTRSTLATTGTLASRNRLSGQLFDLRLGPFLEWNFTPKLSLAASAGLVMAPTSVEYDFSETATLAGGSTFAARGHAAKTTMLYGPYLSGVLRYDLSKGWGVYVGGQFQSLNDLELSAGNRTARFDAGAVIYATAGVTFRF